MNAQPVKAMVNAPRPGSNRAVRALWHTYEHGVVSLWNVRLLTRYSMASATEKKSDERP